MLHDGLTIVALSSPPGVSARAIVRVSGPEAIDAVAALLVSNGDAGAASSSSPASALTELGGFRGRAVRLAVGHAILPAWLTVFRVPRSYTREDLVEIHAPGSRPVLDALARSLVSRDGVRWAHPGEFTLRAYLSGRVDLSRAEAVEQLIAATSEDEVRAARRSLSGELAREVERVREALVEGLALLEAALDFPDEDLPEIAPAPVLERIEAIAATIARLRLSTSLRISSSGVRRVVLAGYPNAGKSSLLNRILGRHAAIVSSLEGTTRDPVRGRTESGGRTIEWIDVAGAFGDEGVGATVPQLEQQLDPDDRNALRRLTDFELRSADLVVWVVDVADRLARESIGRGRSIDALVVANKIDLPSSTTDRPQVVVSARTGQGIDSLLAAVHRRLDGGPAASGGCESTFLTTAHQEAALERADARAHRAREALAAGLGYECAAADLRGALGAMEDIVGRVTTDDVLGHIFSRFCIGK